MYSHRLTATAGACNTRLDASHHPHTAINSISHSLVVQYPPSEVHSAGQGCACAGQGWENVPSLLRMGLGVGHPLRAQAHVGRTRAGARQPSEPCILPMPPPGRILGNRLCSIWAGRLVAAGRCGGDYHAVVVLAQPVRMAQVAQLQHPIGRVLLTQGDQGHAHRIHAHLLLQHLQGKEEGVGGGGRDSRRCVWGGRGQ